MYGDGSDGVLNVASGSRSLPLDVKHQFTTVNVASGATLTTSSTSGSVLYITATDTITIDGKIDVSNKVQAGDNSWSVTIDGVTYTTPGVANGGGGGSYTGGSPASQGDGFGGGGGGVNVTSSGTLYAGGDGGTGGATPNGGNSFTATRTSNGTSTGKNDGLQGGGGSGIAFASLSGLSGGYTVRGISGAGGEYHGASGANGSGNIVDNGSATYSWYGGGGGGAGGSAGKSGVHVYLCAPEIVINGQIITVGSSGSVGGTGGRTKSNAGWENYYGGGGGGGGGGRGGNIRLKTSLLTETTATYTMGGGAGGAGGAGGLSLGDFGGNGSSGASGNKSTTVSAPAARFSTPSLSVFNSAVVPFTDTSLGGVTSWSWSFGDGGTSTLQNPTHTYTSNGSYTVSLTSYKGGLSDTTTKSVTVSIKSTTVLVSSFHASGGLSTLDSESSEYTILSFHSSASVARMSTTYLALPQKDYEYRVFDSDGNYLSTLKNVTSQFGYTQNVNENASELTISIARSPDNKSLILEPLKDQTGANILDTNSSIIYVPTESPNSVGPGSDIDLNFNLEVWAFYGGYDSLQDTFGVDILDQDGDQILVPYGAPNGKRVYAGYIVDYELTYGETTGVSVIVVPHATEMMHYAYKTGANTTTIAHLNTDPVLMARNALDNYASQGGIVSYDSDSMPLSGHSSDYTFSLQTTREVVDKSIELLPSGYYHFVHPGENKQYLLTKALTPHHTFYYEKHISSLVLKKSISQLVNKVYFVGGDTGGSILYKYDDDATSIASTRPGLDRISDSRVTVGASAATIMDYKIQAYKDPRYRTSVTLSDGVYEIESIRLGQMVAFKNFATFLDTLLLQIVSISRSEHTVTIVLDMVVPSDSKRLIELKKQLRDQEVIGIPTAPS